MSYFVDEHSIVRKIWGKADTVLFIFAGAAAEFALNKAVDWLYFTGKLPADSLGRLFSTVDYSRQILFSEHEAALRSIDKITAIHKGVETARGARIPDWAYRDVLFLLIDLSIRSYELLESPLTLVEKTEVFNVFARVGQRMGLNGLPDNYAQYLQMRKDHLEQNLVKSTFTVNLYLQYRKHLGFIRYQILRQAQLLTVPEQVSAQLPLGKIAWLQLVLKVYRIVKHVKPGKLFRDALLPIQYKARIQAMDLTPVLN